MGRKKQLKGKPSGIKPYIWYAGKRCRFETETDSTDEAQALLDYYRRLGYQACCLHERGKHQVYVATEKGR